LGELFSFMLGLGNLLGYFTGYLNLLKYMPFFGTQYRALFTISMAVLAICLTITLLTIKETPPITNERIGNPFETIYYGIKHMPPVVSRVCVVQFFSWIAWFTFILFITDWVGEDVFGGNPFAPEGSASRAAYDNGVRHGALALSLNAVVTIIMSVVLSKIVESIGYRPVYFVSQMILAACLIATNWIKNVYAAQVIILVCGIPWAVTMILPFTIVGQGVLPSQGGLYMGALNIFVVLPQIMVSVFVPFIISIFDHKVVSALVAGGISSIIAAFCALRLITPPGQYEEVIVIDNRVDETTTLQPGGKNVTYSTAEDNSALPLTS